VNKLFVELIEIISSLEMKNSRIKNLIFRILICFIAFFISSYSIAQVRTEVGLPFDFNPGNEFDPAFSNDGSQLVFVSDKSGQFKLYISRKENNVWSDPVEIPEINGFNNGVGNIRYPSFNYDASILYFSADFNKDSSNVDIFYSENRGGVWSEPKSIGAPVNSLLYDGQPSISPDDRTLYFVRPSNSQLYSDMDCKKVFLSKKNLDGSWSTPEELPIPINVDCEQTPKISLDNKTLYFSSLREGGKGGFDIYKTKLIAKNVWLPAESLDTLNTPDNEFSPSLYFDNSMAFFSVEKVEKKNLSSKIFKIDIPIQYLPVNNVKLSGKIKEHSTGNPINTNISVYDPVTSRLMLNFSNNEANGEYNFYLPAGSNYLVDFNKAGYSHNFVNIEALEIAKNELITKDVLLYKDVNLILNIFDNEIFKPVEASIEIRNSENQLVKTEIKQLEVGRFKINIPLGEKYHFFIQADYFEPYDFEFDLTGIVQFDEFERDAELVSKKVDFQIDIADAQSLEGIPVEVVITNLDNNEVIRTTAIANNEGKYVVKLREGDRYNVSVSPKGYSYYSTTVDLKKKESSKKLDVKLQQLKEDTKLTLNNITFEVNSADLTLSSNEELDRVVKLMLDNPGMRIEVSAHTDNVGSDSYNLRLSKRRAKSVMDYLVEKKVGVDRIISQGYGKNKPLVTNDTEANRALNRRVELKIIKIE
jgi:outer membrane protein OmpA-like peptidoglycan-associated protein